MIRVLPRGGLGLTLLTVGLTAHLAGCPASPDPCLWVVTNAVGPAVDLRGLFVREPAGEWGENILGDAAAVGYGDSFSFLLPPDTPSLDLRAADGNGTTWSRYGASGCEDGDRIATTLTPSDLDVPCTWTITNRLGDAAVNYALLEVWIRATGSAEWGSGLLPEAIGFDGAVQIPVETGRTYDLSAMDQDGIFYLRSGDQTCLDGEDLSTTLTLADEAPPCLWQVTNRIDGALGPLALVQLAVTPSGTGQTTVYDLSSRLEFGDTTEVPFFPRAVWDLQAVDELGQTYSYPESALCLDGGELYALDVVAGDVD